MCEKEENDIYLKLSHTTSRHIPTFSARLFRPLSSTPLNYPLHSNQRVRHTLCPFFIIWPCERLRDNRGFVSRVLQLTSETLSGVIIQLARKEGQEREGVCVGKREMKKKEEKFQIKLINKYILSLITRIINKFSFQVFHFHFCIYSKHLMIQNNSSSDLGDLCVDLWVESREH